MKSALGAVSVTALLLLAGCQAESGTAALESAGQAASATVEAPRSEQPTPAAYRCEDGPLTITAIADSVAFTTPGGESLVLPAAPAGQQNRFGEGRLALVVEGGEALFMQDGKEPMTCRR